MAHRRLLTIAAACASLGAPARAAPLFAPLFQDHGVLQCEKAVPVWGRASPGEHVIVTFGGQKVGSTAGPDGRWVAMLAPLAANPIGADLTVTGRAATVIHDIVVGEVWLCAGGEGIEANAPTDAPARYPLVRQFRVAHRASAAPVNDASGEWKACTPETVVALSAVGYFYSRELFARLGVPVGVVTASLPKAPLEAWMSPAALSGFPGVSPASRPGEAGSNGASEPSSLFNGMIQPVLPYAIRGVVWSEGEGDVGRAVDYAVRFPAWITALRSHFGEGDLPFFWVQAAGPASSVGDPREMWPRLREAQSMALRLPATGQAVCVDVGNAGYAEIARRLALIAKATVYSIPVDYSGPVYGGATVEGSAMRVRFQFAGEGLTASDKPLQSFEIAGADRVFHSAVAAIHGDSVVVQSPAVRQPVAVRYAWRNPRDANLFDGAGLPAAPFRSDDW